MYLYLSSVHLRCVAWSCLTSSPPPAPHRGSRELVSVWCLMSGLCWLSPVFQRSGLLWRTSAGVCTTTTGWCRSAPPSPTPPCTDSGRPGSGSARRSVSRDTHYSNAKLTLMFKTKNSLEKLQNIASSDGRHRNLRDALHRSEKINKNL